MAERIVFRQVDIDRTDYRDATGRWVLERSFTEGPRGGRQTVWHLYEVRAESLHEIAVERRLRDIWKHIPEDDHVEDAQALGVDPSDPGAVGLREWLK